jgi:hypothetical protein
VKKLILSIEPVTTAAALVLAGAAGLPYLDPASQRLTCPD